MNKKKRTFKQSKIYKKINTLNTVVVAMIFPTVLLLLADKIEELVAREPLSFTGVVVEASRCFNAITYADLLYIALLGITLGMVSVFLMLIINDS